MKRPSRSLAMALNSGVRGLWIRAAAKQPLDVDRIESIGPAAEFAGDGHRALFGQNAAHLVGRASAASCDTTLAAAAGKTNRRALEQAAIVFAADALQHFLRRAQPQQRGIERRTRDCSPPHVLRHCASASPCAPAAAGSFCNSTPPPLTWSALNAMRVGNCSEVAK